ncbi:MAG TPA: FAD-binding oxidoreductase, partial [Gemmatimonadaceae bacterium]|nr:FAD-binding oxidoreductase [Gemmatimonadaceae bacterium]
MSIGLSSDKSVRDAYEADASGLHLVPDLVARPESVDDVIEVVRKAASDRTPITCAGAQTSTTGASITDKGILLSLLSLDRISPPDEKGRTINVEPGALVGEIKRTAAAAGLLFAPDP